MKKALSLLLAVLMLVSLFSGMAYADDDVIVEEPVVEEPVVDEAPDAYTDEGNFEAADAVVEEFTDEGSFEAADIQTYQDFEEWLEGMSGWAIERIDPAKPVCGTIVKVWVHDADGIVAAPREVLFDHVWADPNDPEKPAVMDDDPTLIKDGVNGWKLISSSQTSCTEGGTLVYKRVCLLNPEHFEIEEVTISKGTHVWATDPFTYAYFNGFVRTNTDGTEREVDPENVDWYDEDATENMPEDLRAIKVMPTKTKAGVGHEVCAICGAENPNTEDYPIGKHVETAGDKLNDFHIYSPWREMVPPTCSAEGWEERVCNIPGCQGSENRQIEKWDHTDPETGADLMVCVGIERVSCVEYVEVWECTNPLCCTEVVKDPVTGEYVQNSTYPEASQYVEFRGNIETTNYATWTNLKAAKEAATGTDLYKAFKQAEDDRNASYQDAIDKLKAGEITAASFTDLVKEADNTYDQAIASLDFTAGPFFCYLDTTQKNTNEHYVHHKYESDYEQVIAPDCCVPGVSTRVCSDCDGIGMFTEDPLEPIWSAQHYLTNKANATATDVLPYYYHYVKCIRPGCAAKDLHPDLASSEDFDEKDPETYIQDNNMNPQTKIVDHDWGDWIVELPPQGANRGHWYRTCMTKYCNGREDYFGTQEEFDRDHGGEPVVAGGLRWEEEDDEWVCKLYDDEGRFDDDFTGMVDFKGGKFFVVNGYMQKDTNGPTLVGDKWYYLAAGQVQEVTTLAQYGKDWFYVVDGVIDLDEVGLVEYDGGKFVVAKGRVVSEYSGLWFNSKDIGGDDEWYYVANGQVQSDFTGITVYDGEWFYLENGKLIPDYTGEVVYDGVVFEMVNGHLVAA